MRIPRHVAFIMDGNGRWAQARGLSRSSGHKAGFDRIRPVLSHCYDMGIEAVSLFAWSTENWSRPAAEVNYIMGALEKHLPELVNAVHKDGVRFIHIGNKDRLSPVARDLLLRAGERTRNNGPRTFILAFNYGGRDEIVNAARRLAARRARTRPIDEAAIAGNLFVPGLPDVDLLVRSGGERRVSNFMLWQLADAYIHFTDVLWPDMDERAINQALECYDRSELRRAEELEESRGRE